MTQMLSSISPASVPATQKTGSKSDLAGENRIAQTNPGQTASGKTGAELSRPGAASGTGIPGGEALRADLGVANGLVLSDKTGEALNSYVESMKEAVESQRAAASLQSSRGLVGIRDFMADRVAFLETVQPDPGRLLQGDEAAKMRTRFADEDPQIISENGVKAYFADGLRFDFMPDGTIRERDPKVPSTEEDRKNWLTHARESLATLDTATGGRTAGELDRLLAQAQERAEAAAERAESLKAAMEQTRPGQLVDSRA